jgi:hypothetical protein
VAVHVDGGGPPCPPRSLKIHDSGEFVDSENGILLRAPPAVFTSPSKSTIALGVNVDVILDAVTHVLGFVSVSA